MQVMLACVTQQRTEHVAESQAIDDKLRPGFAVLQSMMVEYQMYMTNQLFDNESSASVHST